MVGVGIGTGVYVGAGVRVGLGVGRAVGVGVGIAWAVASTAAVTVAAMSGVGAAVGVTVGFTVGSIEGIDSLPQAANSRSIDTRIPQRNGFTGLFICFPPMPGRDHTGASHACENSTYEPSLWQMTGAIS